MAILLKWSSGAKPGLKRINKPSPTPFFGGVAQISDEMEIDDVDSEDDNFENVSSDEEGYQSGSDERDEFTFEINVDEELIKYAKDF